MCVCGKGHFAERSGAMTPRKKATEPKAKSKPPAPPAPPAPVPPAKRSKKGGKGAEEEAEEVEEVKDEQDLRTATSGMLGFFKYRADPQKNKSRELMSESQEALNVMLTTFCLCFLCLVFLFLVLLQTHPDGARPTPV